MIQMKKNLEPFCKLADSQSYSVCDWDLIADPVGREAWIRIFEDHTASLLEHARSSLAPPTELEIETYRRAYLSSLDDIRRNYLDFAPLHIYKLCEHRAEIMRMHNLGDPYDRVKAEEDAAAMRHLPRVVELLDACSEESIVETHIRGVLAGNKFDLGAKDTAEQHANGGIDFFSTLSDLAPRPWFVDDCDVISERLGRGHVAYRKAIYFVDNAGGDVVLGAIPFARYLADQGCAVVLAANDHPALNDILVNELRELLRKASEVDERLASHVGDGGISVVGTGCDCPLIDLGAVSGECNDAAADCDLVILEGMGRAVESNYDVVLTCDAIHLAMIKNRKLAPYMGCRMYDLVVRFTQANSVPRVGHQGR